MRRTLAVVWLGALMALASCGDDGRGDTDGGPDGSADAARDAGMLDAEPGDDAGPAADAGPDASTDASTPRDAGDGGSDDAGVDAGDDAGATRGGDSCDDDALLITGDLTLADTTEDASDAFSPSGADCPAGGAASGSDRAYELSASGTTAGTWTITVEPDGVTYDPMLYSRSTCEDADCTAGTVLNGAGEMEQITLDLAAGESAWVIVDGELVSAGSYTLTVDAP